MSVPSSSARRVVVLGALSAIAQASARRLAAEGAHLALVARDADRLAVVADDLRVLGAGSVSTHVGDLAATPNPEAALALYAEAHGGEAMDTVLLFYGVLGDQAAAEHDLAAARAILDVNFTTAALWMQASANHVTASAHRAPVVMAISSVAGDRGRRSNYVYGAAKGGLSIFMQGLAHRLAAAPARAAGGRVRAITMKLGFVDTPMTDGIAKGGPLWAQPEQIADAIERALRKGGPVVYAPWFWRWIMLAIRITPAPIFNKVNL